MIGKITGRLDHRGADHALIDVGGVGYVVYCSDRTLAALPARGGMVALYTDLLVREDLLQLYGFATLVEREWHRLLTSVQGVGARGALAILGTLGPEALGRAIALGDAASVRAAPGVGPKIAQRVVMELKSKAPAVMAMGDSAAGDFAPHQPGDGAQVAAIAPAKATIPAVSPANAPAAPDTRTAQADALSALTNLGYAPPQAAAAVAEAASAPDAPTETGALIRAALRLLAPKG